jgi:hypothetical protein
MCVEVEVEGIEEMEVVAGGALVVADDDNDDDASLIEGILLLP